jgi:2-dehydro-3-deoxygluconokinase
MVDIIALGEPMVEFNQRADGLLVQGFGGDTSNAAISAARQGASVGYITRLGNDGFGNSVIDLWQQENIDTVEVARDVDAPTGIYFVTHDETGHHYCYYRKHSAASRMSPADISEAYIARAKILHISAISQGISESAADTVFHAITLANRHGTQVSYDTNLRLNLWPEHRARGVIHEAMAQCQIALPSYDDACVLTGLSDPNGIVDFYLSLGAKIVALKQGSEGVIVATAKMRHRVAAKSVKTIDANGAGDTFAGAFLAALVRGLDPLAAAESANIAAAISTTRSGAVTAIPYLADVDNFVANS